MNDWQFDGLQRFRVDDDLIEWEGSGDISVSEISHIFQTAVALQAVRGYVLFLISPHEPWSFPPETRRWLGQFHKTHQAVGATAIVGISPTMTLFIDLVLRAISMVSGRRPKTRFFREREAALLWLLEQRELGQKGLLRHG